MTTSKVTEGMYIRTIVHEPGYFELGQRGQCIAYAEDEDSVDGYAYYIKFDDDVYWYLEADEFELEQ